MSFRGMEPNECHVIFVGPLTREYKRLISGILPLLWHKGPRFQSSSCSLPGLKAGFAKKLLKFLKKFGRPKFYHDLSAVVVLDYVGCFT